MYTARIDAIEDLTSRETLREETIDGVTFRNLIHLKVIPRKGETIELKRKSENYDNPEMIDYLYLRVEDIWYRLEDDKDTDILILVSDKTHDEDYFHLVYLLHAILKDLGVKLPH